MYRGSTIIQCHYWTKSLDCLNLCRVWSVRRSKSTQASNVIEQRHGAGAQRMPPPLPHHVKEFITIERNPSPRQKNSSPSRGTHRHVKEESSTQGHSITERRTQSVIRHQALLRKRTQSIIRHQALPRDTQKTFHRLGKTVATS